MICDELGAHCAEAGQKIVVKHGIPVGPMWLYLVAIAALGCALLYGVLRGASKDRPTPPATRPVYRCNASTGRAACTAPATRIVMLVTGPTEMRVTCDQDAQRLCRTGRAVDLGPIKGARR